MRKLLPGLALLLAACSQEAPPPPPPPVNAVQPEEIDYLAIKEGKLYGAGCNFVAEGGGIAALALAQEKEAIIKLKGKIVRIPADTGSQILPETARPRYAGPEYILHLAPIPGTPRTQNGAVSTPPTNPPN